MEFETITLQKKKFAAMMKASKDIIADLKIDIYDHDHDDFITNQMIVKLEAAVLSSQCQIQRVYHYSEKPSFWDWFHGRRQKITIEIECNDLMLNPPKIDSARMYELRIDTIEKTNN